MKKKATHDDFISLDDFQLDLTDFNLDFEDFQLDLDDFSISLEDEDFSFLDPLKISDDDLSDVLNFSLDELEMQISDITALDDSALDEFLI